MVRDWAGWDGMDGPGLVTGKEWDGVDGWDGIERNRKWLRNEWDGMDGGIGMDGWHGK